MLPTSGHIGRIPAWPMPGKPTPDERRLWRELWKRPQAWAWERNHLLLEVALYVRRYVEAITSDTSPAKSALVLRLGDSLGLTVAGMRANRWRITNVTEQPAQEQPADPAAGDQPAVAGRTVVPARERFTRP